MANISKLIEASDKVQLPVQDSYMLSSNKLYFFTHAATAILVAVVSTCSNMSFSSTYMVCISVAAAIYTVLSVYCAFTSKVTFDENGISMPGGYLFMREKLSWDDVSRAELTGVITYRYFLERIFKTIFSSVFANAELHVTHHSCANAGGINFAIFNRVADKATALRIIREKLGDRFTIYQGKY